MANMVSAEELAVDCELQCCHCNESVNYGEDYIGHLMISHKIFKNFHLELERLKKAKTEKTQGNKRKADLVDLDDDGVEDNVVENTLLLDEKVRENIEQVVNETMNDLLGPIKKLLDVESVPENDENTSAEDLSTDGFENILEILNQLKATVNEMEFPEELLQSLANISLANPDRVEETLQENIEDPKTAASGSGNFQRPSAPKQQKKRSATPVDGSKTRESSSRQSQMPSPRPLQPVRSDNSSRSGRSGKSGYSSNTSRSGSSSNTSSTSETGVRKTMYGCPLNDCNFSTDKDGMTNKVALNHLQLEHGVTDEMIKTRKDPTTYKFRKVKREVMA